jgi:hypothetical protein
MTGAALLLFVLAADGNLDTVDGLWLCLYGAAYLTLLAALARRESRRPAVPAAGGPSPSHDHDITDAPPERARPVAVRALLLVLGLAVIVVGSEYLVDGAVGIARVLGASDAVIGLTVVAITTTAPELVTTMVSTVRGDRSIAIGNLIGSSVFNIALILGPTVLVAPGAVPVPDDVLALDLVLMVAAAVVSVPVFFTHRRLGRFEGGAFVTTYVAYMVWLLATRLQGPPIVGRTGWSCRGVGWGCGTAGPDLPGAWPATSAARPHRARRVGRVRVCRGSRGRAGSPSASWPGPASYTVVGASRSTPRNHRAGPATGGRPADSKRLSHAPVVASGQRWCGRRGGDTGRRTARPAVAARSGERGRPQRLVTPPRPLQRA